MGNLSDPAWGYQEYQAYQHDECECDWYGRTKKITAHNGSVKREPHMSCRLFVPQTDEWVTGTNRGLIGRPEEDARHLDTESLLQEFALARENAGNSDTEVERLAGEYAKRLRPRETDD